MAKGHKQLSRILKNVLGRPAPPELIVQCDPDMLSKLKAGDPIPSIADLLVNKLIRLALDPNKDCRWAVELVFDRAEGKAPVALNDDEMDVIEEKLNGISTEHLNALAKKYASAQAQGRAGQDPTSENISAGLSISGDDGLSEDKPAHPEGDGGELEMEAGFTRTRGE